ncbi:MAG: zinc-binding dehydrogenase [Candidatus Bathyarchaeia archaeon]
MLALRYYATDDCKLEDVEKPRIGPNDVLLKIAYAPVCGTDLAILHGKIRAKPGVIMGHEYSGLVQDVGEKVESFRKGDRVIGSPAVSCGNCYFCRRNLTQLCTRYLMFGHEIDGSFSEYMLVPNPARVLCPTDMDTETASLIGDTLTTGYHAVEQAKVKEGDNVAIFGAGPIGLATLIVTLTKNPKKVFVVAHRSSFRLKLAEELGADTTIIETEEDPVRRMLHETLIGLDVVIECAGARNAVLNAFRVVRRGGRITIVSIAPDVSVPMKKLMFGEYAIVGSSCPLGPKALKKTLDFVRENKLEDKLRKLITHRFSLRDGKRALSFYDSPDRAKVLIQM